MSAITVSNEREINPMQLSVEQLHSLKNQHEEELQELQRQLDSLTAARSKFINAKFSVNEIAKAENDTFLYIPLSPSLYVPGNIVEKDTVIVELGTGYYCEKSIPDAQALIERKVTLINQSIETIEQVGLQKKKNVANLNQVIQYKMAISVK